MKKMIVLFTLVFAFSAFAADKVKTVTLNVSGMSCQSCAGTVEKALNKVDGVKEAKVDLKQNKATIIFASAKTSISSLIKAVSDAGFDASNGKATQKSEMKKKSAEGDDCCGDECDTHAKGTKAKKTEVKKS